jgi:hypothetical protein
MRILLSLLLALVLCGLCLATTQNVGEDFGRYWLTQNSNKFVSGGANDLWNWGGKPRGYEVYNGTLYQLLAPTDWYYPAFMSNATPIVINGTALIRNANYAPIDLLFPDPKTDPWYIAQRTGRPVAVVHPAGLNSPF